MRFRNPCPEIPKEAIAMNIHSSTRAKAACLAIAVALVFSSCSGAGVKGASLKSFSERPGTGGNITLNLSRDQEAILGSWEDPAYGRSGLVEGEVKDNGAFTLSIFSVDTRDVVGRLAGAYSKGESLITGTIQFGNDPARPIALESRSEPVAGLQVRSVHATSMKYLAKTATDPTKFYYFAFEPTRPADFRDWYRKNFQGGKSLSSILEQERKAFIEDFENTTKDRAAQVKQPELLPAWLYDGRQFLAFRGKGLLVMGLRRSVFTGDKDVSSSLRYVVIDEAGKTVLGPDAFLNDGWDITLPSILGASVREELGLAEGDSLIENGLLTETVEPGKDFIVYSRGLAFHYGPGELAPASAGEFFVYVPFDRLGGLLREGVLEKYGLGVPAAAPVTQ
jgi:hypothetical protein